MKTRSTFGRREPAPLYQVLPPSWHKRWLAMTHGINAVIARNLPRLLGYQFIVSARPKDGGWRAGDA